MKAPFFFTAVLTFVSLASAQTPPTVPAGPPAATSTQRTPEQQQKFDEVKVANANFFRSIAVKDIPTLNEILADDAVLSGAGPLQVDTKTSFAFAVATPNFPVKAITVNEVDVRLQSETVVAFGTVSINERAAQDTARYKASFMNVFAKRDGKWKLIISYSAPLQQQR